MGNKVEKFNQLQIWADQLQEMQKDKNSDRGVECVRWIIADLRNDNIEKARVNYHNQSDKFDSWPDIKKYLKDIG